MQYLSHSLTRSWRVSLKVPQQDCKNTGCDTHIDTLAKWRASTHLHYKLSQQMCESWRFSWSRQLPLRGENQNSRQMRQDAFMSGETGTLWTRHSEIPGKLEWSVCIVVLWEGVGVHSAVVVILQPSYLIPGEPKVSKRNNCCGWNGNSVLTVDCKLGCVSTWWMG